MCNVNSFRDKNQQNVREAETKKERGDIWNIGKTNLDLLSKTTKFRTKQTSHRRNPYTFETEQVQNDSSEPASCTTSIDRFNTRDITQSWRSRTPILSLISRHERNEDPRGNWANKSNVWTKRNKKRKRESKGERKRKRKGEEGRGDTHGYLSRPSRRVTDRKPRVSSLIIHTVAGGT